MASATTISAVLLTAQPRPVPNTSRALQRSLGAGNYQFHSLETATADSSEWFQSPLSNLVGFPIKLAKAPRTPSSSSSAPNLIARSLLRDLAPRSAQGVQQSAGTERMIGDIVVMRQDGRDIHPGQVAALSTYINRNLMSTAMDQNVKLDEKFDSELFEKWFNDWTAAQGIREWRQVPSPVGVGRSPAKTKASMTSQSSPSKQGPVGENVVGPSRAGGKGKEPAGRKGLGQEQTEGARRTRSDETGSSTTRVLVDCIRLSPYSNHRADDSLSGLLEREGIFEQQLPREHLVLLAQQDWPASPVSQAMGFPLVAYKDRNTLMPNGRKLLSSESDVNTNANKLFWIMDTTHSAFGTPDIDARGDELRGDLILVRPDHGPLKAAHMQALLAAIDDAVGRATPNPSRRRIDNLFTPQRLLEAFTRLRTGGMRRGLLEWQTIEGPILGVGPGDQENAVRASGAEAQLSSPLRRLASQSSTSSTGRRGRGPPDFNFSGRYNRQAEPDSR